MKTLSMHQDRRRAESPLAERSGILLAGLLFIVLMAIPCRAFGETPYTEGDNLYVNLNYQQFIIGHENDSYQLQYEPGSASSTYSYKVSIKAGDTIRLSQSGGSGTMYADGGLSLIPDGDQDYGGKVEHPTEDPDWGDFEYYIQSDSAGYVVQQPPASNRGFTANHCAYTVKPNDKQVTIYARSKTESVTVEFTVGGSTGPSLFIKEDSQANNNSTGWETGFVVPAAVAAAIAAAIAATRLAKRKKKPTSDETQNEEENEDESCTYELRMAKYFGNTLYVGDEPSNVYARVVKNTKREVGIYDEDLTNQVVISSGSDNVKVVPASGIQNGYKVAAVSAIDMNQDPALVEEGIVEFAVITPVAGYANRVHFRVERRAPRVVFIDKDFLTALAGDGTTRATRFEIENVIGVPDSILVEAPDDLKASCEHVKNTRHKLVVENNVPAFEKPFYKEERREVTLRIFYGKEEIVVKVPVYLYPDGLSIQSRKVKDGRLMIDSYKKVKDGGAEEMPRTEIELKYAYNDIGPDGTVTTRFEDMSEAEVEICSFSSQEEHTKRMLTHYSCDIDSRMADVNMFFITPEFTVPAYYHIVNGRKKSPDIQYLATMVLKASFTVAHRQGGMSWNQVQRYDDDINVPIQVVGQPFDPLSPWDREYKNLQHAIDVFIDDDDQKQRAYTLLDQNGRNMTPTELYIRRNALFISARNRWMADSAIAMAESRYYDYLIEAAEAVKFVGDVAFSYLMVVYAGPFAEAVLSPAKNMFIGAIAEWGASYRTDTAFDWESFGLKEEFNNLGDNMIMSMYSVKSPAKMALAAKVLACMYLYNVVYHFAVDVDENGQRSWYKAFGSAFKNVSIGFTKILVGEAFQKLMNNQKVKELLFDKLGAWIKGRLSEKVLTALADDAFFKQTGNVIEVIPVKLESIAQKALEETLGKGAGWIFDWATASSTPKGPDQVDIPIEAPDADEQRKAAYIARIDIQKVISSENPASQAMFEDLYGWWYDEPANPTVDWPDAPVVPDDIAEGKNK